MPVWGQKMQRTDDVEIVRKAAAIGVGLPRNRGFGCRDRRVDFGSRYERPGGTRFGGVAGQGRDRAAIEFEVVLVTIVVEQRFAKDVLVVDPLRKRYIKGFFVSDDKVVAAAERAVRHMVQYRHRNGSATFRARDLHAVVVFDDGLVIITIFL